MYTDGEKIIAFSMCVISKLCYLNFESCAKSIFCPNGIIDLWGKNIFIIHIAWEKSFVSNP